MKLRDRCEYIKSEKCVKVSRGPQSGETFRYRWVPVRSSADVEAKFAEGRFDDSIRQMDQNSVLEVVDGEETCVINPGLKQKLIIKQNIKKDHTEISVAKGSMTGGIHPSRVFLIDRAGNKLLIGSLAEGTTWYLPEGVEMGFKGGEWHFAADRYCEDVFSASYEN